MIVELLFELVLQFVFEGIGEALVELGYRGTARVLRSWVGRTVTLALLGLGAGWAWGSYLNEAGRVELPRTFWTSLAIAAAGLALIVWRLTQPPESESTALLAPPWRWPVQRVAGYVVLSLMVAAGVWGGFAPRPLT